MESSRESSGKKHGSGRQHGEVRNIGVSSLSKHDNPEDMSPSQSSGESPLAEWNEMPGTSATGGCQSSKHGKVDPGKVDSIGHSDKPIGNQVVKPGDKEDIAGLGEHGINSSSPFFGAGDHQRIRGRCPGFKLGKCEPLKLAIVEDSNEGFISSSNNPDNKDRTTWGDVAGQDGTWDANIGSSARRGKFETYKTQESDLDSSSRLDWSSFGYELPEVSFVCVLCDDILIDTMQSACGHLFCKHCLLVLGKSTDLCPTCGTSVIPISSVPNVDQEIVEFHSRNCDLMIQEHRAEKIRSREVASEAFARFVAQEMGKPGSRKKFSPAFKHIQKAIFEEQRKALCASLQATTKEPQQGGASRPILGTSCTKLAIQTGSKLPTTSFLPPIQLKPRFTFPPLKKQEQVLDRSFSEGLKLEERSSTQFQLSPLSEIPKKRLPPSQVLEENQKAFERKKLERESSRLKQGLNKRYAQIFANARQVNQEQDERMLKFRRDSHEQIRIGPHNYSKGTVGVAHTSPDPLQKSNHPTLWTTGPGKLDIDNITHTSIDYTKLPPNTDGRHQKISLRPVKTNAMKKLLKETKAANKLRSFLGEYSFQKIVDQSSEEEFEELDVQEENIKKADDENHEDKLVEDATGGGGFVLHGHAKEEQVGRPLEPMEPAKGGKSKKKRDKKSVQFNAPITAESSSLKRNVPPRPATPFSKSPEETQNSSMSPPSICSSSTSIKTSSKPDKPRYEIHPEVKDFMKKNKITTKIPAVVPDLYLSISDPVDGDEFEEVKTDQIHELLATIREEYPPPPPEDDDRCKLSRAPIEAKDLLKLFESKNEQSINGSNNTQLNKDASPSTSSSKNTQPKKDDSPSTGRSNKSQPKKDDSPSTGRSSNTKPKKDDSPSTGRSNNTKPKKDDSPSTGRSNNTKPKEDDSPSTGRTNNTQSKKAASSSTSGSKNVQPKKDTAPPKFAYKDIRRKENATPKLPKKKEEPDELKEFYEQGKAFYCGPGGKFLPVKKEDYPKF